MRPASVENTINPNKISTKAVLIQRVTACKPERLPVVLRFFPISELAITMQIWHKSSNLIIIKQVFNVH